LVFTPSGQSDAFLRILRAYALADCPDEPGAAEHRFTVERIDSARGSAAGYVAKYVAKNIDGHGLSEDDETGEAGATAAQRIVAWARLWGIRQFQFFGLPPITPNRELYQYKGPGFASLALEQAHQASKARDYAGYLQVLEAHGLALRVDYEDRPSRRYPGELASAIRGLQACGGDLHELRVIVTRNERWAIQPRPARANTGATGAPWTRFNNCAPPVGSTTCARGGHRDDEGRAIHAREGRRRRPSTTTQPALAAA
jgi:hypothetical protein